MFLTIKGQTIFKAKKSNLTKRNSAGEIQLLYNIYMRHCHILNGLAYSFFNPLSPVYQSPRGNNPRRPRHPTPSVKLPETRIAFKKCNYNSRTKLVPMRVNDTNVYKKSVKESSVKEIRNLSTHHCFFFSKNPDRLIKLFSLIEYNLCLHMHIHRDFNTRFEAS